MTRFLVHFEKAGGNGNPLAFGIYASFKEPQILKKIEAAVRLLG